MKLPSMDVQSHKKFLQTNFTNVLENLFYTILGSFAILLAEPPLPAIIDIWHVIVVRPEMNALPETTIPWSEKLKNPFSASFLQASIDLQSQIMSRGSIRLKTFLPIRFCSKYLKKIIEENSIFEII